MKLNLNNWSERQQVAAVIVVAGILIALLTYFLLLPQTRRRKALQSDIRRMQTQLTQKNYLLGEAALEGKLADAKRYTGQLLTEWKETTSRLSTFRDVDDLKASQVDHIDFKVALFQVRNALRQKSMKRQIRLPHDLGMKTAVYGNEDARQLMLQLRGVEKLVDLALDVQINMVRRIMPLDPIRHHVDTKKGKQAFLEEYPVSLQFYGTLDNLYDLFRAVLTDKQVFSLRHIRIEPAATSGNAELLDVSVVMSALVFLSDADEMMPTPSKIKGRARPMGH